MGNNEVYELFQSAWSGAPYLEDTSETEDEIAIVTDLGLIPLSDVTARKEKTRKTDRNRMIVDKIEALQQSMGIKKLRQSLAASTCKSTITKSYRSLQKKGHPICFNR